MNDDMATMPVPELVEHIRQRDWGDSLVLGLVMNVMANRLTNEYDRAEALQAKIDDCEYQRCPCR